MVYLSSASSSRSRLQRLQGRRPVRNRAVGALPPTARRRTVALTCPCWRVYMSMLAPLHVHVGGGAAPRYVRAMATAKKPAARPSSLAARNASAHAAKVTRLKAAGTAAIERVRDLRARIEDDFLEIGQELVTLNDPLVIAALGYEDFTAVCTDALGMSAGKARQLISVTTRLAPQLARSLGQDRAVALLSLVDATPEEDTAAEVWKATIALPDGTKLDVDKASTKAIREAATALRRHHAAKSGKKRRGLTVSAEEQAAAKKIEATIGRDAKLAGTTVALKAGTKERGARVVIGVDLALAGRMAKAVGKATWA